MNRIKINDTEFAYKFSKGAIIEFEKSTGKTLGKDDTTMEENVKLCYLAMKHGCKAENIVFKTTFEDFVDLDTKYDIVDEMTKVLTASVGEQTGS
jgi:hypothetical protein